MNSSVPKVVNNNNNDQNSNMDSQQETRQETQIPSLGNLMTGVTAVFQSHVTAFAQRLVELTDGKVSKDEIFSAWNSVSDIQLVLTKETPPPKKPRSSAKSTTNPDSAPKKNAPKKPIITGVRCGYMFKRGARKEQECGANVPDEGRSTCNRHKKYEHISGTTPIEDVSESKRDQPKPKKKQVQMPSSRKLFKDKVTGRYIHPSTGLVIDKNSKKVVGTQNEDGDIVPLTSEDVKNAAKFNFKVDDTASVDNNGEDSEDKEDNEDKEDKEDNEDDEEKEHVIQEDTEELVENNDEEKSPDNDNDEENNDEEDEDELVEEEEDDELED
jgi:hypothetical protein